MYQLWDYQRAGFRVFDQIFQGLRDDLAELLLRRLIAKSRKGLLPGVGDALREAAELVLEDQGAPLLSIEQAWAQVRPLIETEGRHRKPSFKNPSVSDAIESLGWSHICQMRPMRALRAFGGIFAKLEAKRLEQAATDLCPMKPLLPRCDKAPELEGQMETRKSDRRLTAVPSRAGGVDFSVPRGDRE